MSQLDIIRETETEKKEISQTTQTISENAEANENEITEELTDSKKESKVKLSPVVRIEKSRVIADLTTKSDKTPETAAIDEIKKEDDSSNDDIKKSQLRLTKEPAIILDSDKEKTVAFIEQETKTKATTEEEKDFKKNSLTEKPMVIEKKSDLSSVSQNPDETKTNVSITDSADTASKLAVEDKIILENIDKLLNTDKSTNKNAVKDSDTKTNSKESTEIRDENVDDTENLIEIDVVGDESPHETDIVSSKGFENTHKNSIEHNTSDSPEIESKTVLADENNALKENLKDKSLSSLLPNQMNVSVGSDDSFRINLSLHDTETGSSQEDLFPSNKEIVTEESTLNTSGNSDKENTKSAEQLKESTPKSKTSNEKKVPLTNVSFNEINENSKSAKGSPHDSFCEPMEVDDPPLTYREITPGNKRQSLNNNREKSLTPTKKTRKSTDNIPAEEPQQSFSQNVTTIKVNEKDESIENISKKDVKSDEEDTIRNENNKHTSESPPESKGTYTKIANAVGDSAIRTEDPVEDVECPQSSTKCCEPVPEPGEEDCASPVFSLSNTDISEGEENNLSIKEVVEDNLENKKSPLSEIATEFELGAKNKDISKEFDSKGDHKRSDNVASCENKVLQSEHESSDNSISPKSLKTELQSNCSTISKENASQVEIPEDLTNKDLICIGKESPAATPVDEGNVSISEKNSGKSISQENSIQELGRDQEIDEPVASTSTAKNNVPLTNSPSSKKIKIVSDVVVNEKELQSICITNKKDMSDEKDSNIQSCKNQKIIADAKRNEKVDVASNLEIDSSLSIENRESDSKEISGLPSDGISSETSKLTTNVDADVSPSRMMKILKPMNIQVHAVTETKVISSPNKSSTQNNIGELDTKNKSFKKKNSKTSKSKEKDDEDDLEEKVEKLIEDALKEVSLNSSEEEEIEEDDKSEADDDEEERLENVNEYIDDMAEEVEDEEETPSEDSNEIVCDGESINSSDTYTEGDDDSDDNDSDGNDSFIDDGEEQELLSGEEDFLQNLSPKKEKAKVVSPPKLSKKHKRIITPSESEDENQDSITEIFPNNDQGHIVAAEVIEDNIEENVSDGETANLENETAIVKEDKITNVAAETRANIPVDLIPSKNDIIYVDNDSDSVTSVKEESTNQKDLNNSFDKKSKRKSSITIQENIKLEDVQDGELTERISKVVDWFYSGIKGKKCDTGNISFNVSLDYDDQSSVEENVTTEANDSVTSKYKKNYGDIEIQLPKRPVLEKDDNDDVFVATLSKTEETQSPKKLKKQKRESLQKQSDDEEIPTLIEVNNELSTFRETSKQSPQTAIKLPKTRTSGTKRLSGESIQHLSPKRSKLGSEFIVESLVFDADGKKKSKKVEGYIVKEMQENLEMSNKKIKKKEKTEADTFQPTVHKMVKKVKSKKNSSDNENATGFSDDIFVNKNKSAKKKRNLDDEFNVEIDYINSHKKKKYALATKETDRIPCSSGILKLHVSTDTNVSKREVETSNVDKAKKLKRNLSQKLLPTRNTDLNDSWESEVFDESLHPSVSNKKISNAAISKKKKTEGPFSSKDFKNRMLYDSSRIKRVDTKILLRQRRNV